MFGVSNAGLGQPVHTNRQLAVLPYPVSAQIRAVLAGFAQSDTWSAVADTVKQAYQGNQVALEATGGMLAGIILPGKKVPGGTVASDASKAESTAAKATGGAENIATYPKLKDDLVQQNLNNIAKQDPRLEIAIKGDGSGKKDFSMGKGSSAEADRLGKIWLGDGAKKTSGGSWISADGTRGYRPPSAKDSPFATTGTQANFETYEINSSGKSVKVGNGHLNILD
nr:hypothetical protein [Serratia proteamaculans]